MANETKNQEFNRSIKQLQTMVKDKMLVNLAEKFFNLKNEMSQLTRNLKEKENTLASQQQAESKVEIKKEETPSVVSSDNATEIKQISTDIRPKEEKPRAVDGMAQKSMDANYQNQQRNNKNLGFNNQNRQNFNQNRNFQQQGFNAQNRNFNQRGQFNNNNFKRPNPNGQNGFKPNGANPQRPFNPNFKPGQRPNPNFKPGQKPPFNKDGQSKRPAINYAQPIITASPARSFSGRNASIIRETY